MPRIANLISTWFGCGYAPVAPGTAGSAAAVLIAIFLHHHLGMPSPYLALLALLLFFPAVWAAGITAQVKKQKDPSCVVVDEVIGQWITLAGAHPLEIKSLIAGFILFRLFDIWKPWPVRNLEALPGGWGINADDAMAGIYGALVLFLAGWLGLY